MARLRNQAFTLVELLVVIGIIAVLMSILMPVLGKARNQATNVKCASNLRSIGQSLHIYGVANKGKLPMHHVNGDAHWLWDVPNATRDALIGVSPGKAVTSHAGGSRDILYCPFSYEQNVDALWNYAPNTAQPERGFAVLGYASLIKRLPNSLLVNVTLVEREFVQTFRPTGIKTPGAPTKPAEIEVMVDAIVSQNGVFGVRGGWAGGIHVTPHMYRGKVEGGNALYLDGHVAFVPFKGMKQRFTSPASMADQVSFWWGHGSAPQTNNPPPR